MAFSNLDIKKVTCFGWSLPKAQCWWYLANKTRSDSWRHMDLAAFQKSFAKNVDESYMHLFEAEFEDLDDSIHYTVFFDNQKRLFDLKLSNTKSGEILPEQRKTFFKSDIFIKTAERAYEILLRSLKLFNETIKTHVENAELLDVNEIKLEAIESFLNDQQLMKNFRLKKYVKK